MDWGGTWPNLDYANLAFVLSNESIEHLRNPYYLMCLVMCYVLAEEEQGDYIWLQKGSA